VVDPLVRRGYRFKGRAQVFGAGADYEAGLDFYRRRGSTSAKPLIVLVEVAYAANWSRPPTTPGRARRR
jgi:hypothetical protein